MYSTALSLRASFRNVSEIGADTCITITITISQLLFMFWWGFWTSGLALSLKEQHVCIVVWPLFQTGNRGPAQNLYPESVHYMYMLMAAVRTGSCSFTFAIRIRQIAEAFGKL